MRILFVIHTPKDPLTAVYRNVSQRAQYFINHNHQAEILTPNDFPWLERLSQRWHPLLYPVIIAIYLIRLKHNHNVIVFHSYAGWTFNFLRKLCPRYRQSQTVTSFHGLEPLHYNILKADAERSGKPLSLRYRIMHGKIKMRLIRASCRRSDLVICLNTQEKAYLTKNCWSDKAKLVLLPNGVNKRFFIARHTKKDVVVLLFVGQWLRLKGIKYLIEAFSLIAGGRPYLQLWCVGTGIAEQVVLADFPEQVRAQVVVHSHVTREEIPLIYNQADVFVFPSLSEGSSLALLEAMATALPIVTIPVGAAPDMIETEVNGLLVPPQDSIALANAIQRFCDDFSLRDRLGKSAQETARRYEYDSLYKDFVQKVEQLVIQSNSTTLTDRLVEWS